MHIKCLAQSLALESTKNCELVEGVHRFLVEPHNGSIFLSLVSDGKTDRSCAQDHAELVMRPALKFIHGWFKCHDHCSSSQSASSLPPSPEPSQSSDEIPQPSSFNSL